MIRALLNRLRPRCAAPGPWRLADCGPCTLPRHHTDERHDDGTGYSWNATRWQWRGPVINLADEYPDDDPARERAVFKEQTP